MCEFVDNTKHSRIDKCMKEFIKNLKMVLHPGFKVVACCCGHQEELKGKYPMTILIKALSSGKVIDIVNGKYIPRKRNFYVKDNEGYYYIPEIVNSKQEICECGHEQWDDHKSSFYEKNKDLKMVAQECSVKGCKCKKFKKAKVSPSQKTGMVKI